MTKIIKLLYSTYPVKDSFSWYLYYCILFNKDYKKLITQSNDIIPLLLCLGALILFMSNHISFII